MDVFCQPKPLYSSSSDNMNDIPDNHIVVDEVLWTVDDEYYYEPVTETYVSISSSSVYKA